MKTTEGNKLIAEFMGYKPFDAFWDKSDNKKWYSINQLTGNSRNSEDELRFHSSWDWLMPVVEKIEQDQGEGYNILIEHRNCWIESDGITIEGYSTESKIEAVFNAVCEYITWYNEN